MKKLWNALVMAVAVLLVLSSCTADRNETTEQMASRPSDIAIVADAEKEESSIENTALSDHLAKSAAADKASDAESGFDTEYVSPAKQGGTYQEENAVVFSSLSGAFGDTVQTELTINGKVNVCAADISFVYDKSKLKLVAYEDTLADLVVNTNASDGRIRLNFVRVHNITKPFVIARFSFEVITEEACESTVEVEVNEIDVLNGTDVVDAPFTVYNGTISLN